MHLKSNETISIFIRISVSLLFRHTVYYSDHKFIRMLTNKNTLPHTLYCLLAKNYAFNAPQQ